jgi:hypothetical protein
MQTSGRGPAPDRSVDEERTMNADAKDVDA